MVVPHWEQAITPWMQLGKQFSKMRMTKEFVADYYVRGVPTEVDFVVDVIFTAGFVLEFITPVEGDTMFSQFLQQRSNGGMQHFVIQFKDSYTFNDFYAMAV